MHGYYRRERGKRATQPTLLYLDRFSPRRTIFDVSRPRDETEGTISDTPIRFLFEFLQFLVGYERILARDRAKQFEEWRVQFARGSSDQQSSDNCENFNSYRS